MLQINVETKKWYWNLFCDGLIYNVNLSHTISYNMAQIHNYLLCVYQFLKIIFQPKEMLQSLQFQVCLLTVAAVLYTQCH